MKTRIAQVTAPKRIKFLFSFQPLGEAKTTGTATTIRKEKAIKANKETWKLKRSIIKFVKRIKQQLNQNYLNKIRNKS